MTYLSNIVRSEGDPRVIRSGRSSLPPADRMARGLGWFSIALGVGELLGARSLARALGMRGSEGLIRSYGAREVLSGVLSLSIDKQAGLWSRVGGDALDLATLYTGLRNDNPKRDNVGAAIAVVLGVTVLDILAANAVGNRHMRSQGTHRDYSDRTGFPRGVDAARGRARRDSSGGRDRQGDSAVNARPLDLPPPSVE